MAESAAASAAASASLKQSGKLSHLFKSGSASSSSLMAVQQELVCSVCLDLFNDPVCLKCGHNVCYRCAYRMVSFAKACSTLQPENVSAKADQARESIENAANEAARIAGTVLMPSDEDKKETMMENKTIEALKELSEPVDPAVEITCPLCREKTRLGDVLPNIVLRNMVTDLRLRAPPSFMPEIKAERIALEKEQELLKEQLRHRPHCGFVSATGFCDKDATVYCADCGSLCEEHAKFLHSTGPARFHKLSSEISADVFTKTQEMIFGSQSQLAFTSEFSMPPCSEHGKAKDLFCMKCQEAVCSHCKAFGTHQSHSCVGMRDAAKLFDEWIAKEKAAVEEMLPSCKTAADSYEEWIKLEDSLRKEAMAEVRSTFTQLLKFAEEHERKVCDHTKILYDTYDENSRRRAEGVNVIIARGKELVEATKSPNRVSAFARELLERDLNEELSLLKTVLKNVPKGDSLLVTVEDHRKLLLDMRIVKIMRNYRLSGCGNTYPINIDSLLASRSSTSELSCSDNSAHDGGAIIDPQRRLIVSVSGNCNNGKDVFFIDIDKKKSERVRDIIPYGNHGQYPVFDGENRVYFFESESRNNDRFGYLDLETRTFTELKKCPSPFREFARSCYMDGKIYSCCRNKNLWVYDVAEETWTDLGVRVGKIGLCADPTTMSLLMLKKRRKFWMYNVETKEETTFPTPPNSLNLGSNQEMIFLRRSSDDFICIVSLDSHSLNVFVSKTKSWTRLQWKDVRNGSAHMVFDPVTSAFYYKIDGERLWYTVPVKMD